MTLHWWMHWFWVTALVFLLSESFSRVNAAPFDMGAPLYIRGVDLHHDVSSHGQVTLHDFKIESDDPEVLIHHPDFPPHETEVTIDDSHFDDELVNSHHAEIDDAHDTRMSHDSEVEPHDASSVQIAPVSPVTGDRRAKAIYIQSKASITPVVITTPPSKPSLVEIPDNKPSTPQLTPETSNATTLAQPSNQTTEKPRDNQTKQEVPVRIATENDSVAVQSATEQTWLLETALTEISHEGFVEASQPEGHTGASVDKEGGIQAGAVAGITLGAVALATLAGIVAFVLYRRRYLNSPQTLNDKCSNPDSSGYLDDSTVRENSEEMYSLDNDSFLNSLEAMTIQNYWTESVKHSKL